MRGACSWGWACLFLVLLSSAAVADLAPPEGGPRPRPQLPEPPRPVEPPAPQASEANTAPVVIRRGAVPAAEKPVVAKIQLPRALVKQLAAKPVSRDGGALVPLNFRTLIAGLSLSAAAVCGLVVLRRKRAARWVAAACVLGGVALGAWGMATADVPPPPPGADAKVAIEIVDGTDTVTILTTE